jgi:hypothetical protein
MGKANKVDCADYLRVAVLPVWEVVSLVPQHTGVLFINTQQVQPALLRDVRLSQQA